MIRVHRVSLDPDTEKALSELGRRLTEVVESDQKVRARALWRSARRPRAGIRIGLDAMAHGSERCMYCGDNQGSDVDHFVPIEHDPILTFAWPNHLLACSLCNSHHKRARFPLDEQGRPLLIDPSVEDPLDHLVLTLSLGEYRALSPRGAAAIDVCQLNRRTLTRGRMQARRVVGMALREWARAVTVQDTARGHEALTAVREQPLADVVQSMLRQAAGPGAGIVFEDEPDVLAALRDDRLRAALLV